MGQYYISHADNNKHKYIAKVKKGLKKYRYFYSKAEYERYLHGGKKQEKKEEKKDDNDNVIDKLSSKVKSAAIAGKKKAQDFLDNFGDKKVKDVVPETKQSKTSKKEEGGADGYDDGKGEPQDHKYIAKVKMKNGKFRYFYNQDDLANYYKQNPDEVPDNAKKLPLLKKPESPEEAMKHINNHFDPNDGSSGYDNNCYSCTLAYDMRRRGYDVDSVYDENGDSLDNIEACYKDAHFEQTRKKGAKLQKELEQKYPEGAHGQICVFWRGGGGHSMAWEIQDGKAIIRDCQSGKVYTNFEKVVGKQYVTGDVNILRTDDKQISDTMATRVTTDQRQSLYDTYSDAGYEDYIDQLHDNLDPILDRLEDYNKNKGIETVSSRRRKRRRTNGVRRK